MTREKAREVLQEQIDKYGKVASARGIEALEFAIKVLEQASTQIYEIPKDYIYDTETEDFLVYRHKYTGKEIHIEKPIPIYALEQVQCADMVDKKSLLEALYNTFHEEGAVNNITKVDLGMILNFVKNFQKKRNKERMTREEAIKRLEEILAEAEEFEMSVCYVTDKEKEIFKMAIKALEQQKEQEAQVRILKKTIEKLQQQKEQEFYVATEMLSDDELKHLKEQIKKARPQLISVEQEPCEDVPDIHVEKRGMTMKIEKTETFIEHDIIFDGTKVGNVELCPERKEITRLVIFDPYQNKGYGTEVVKELVKEGYNYLWVRADNEKAIRVYEKCGFVKDKNTMYEMRYVNKEESEEV